MVGRSFNSPRTTERLHGSAKTLGFELPYTVAEIDTACRETLAVANLEDAYVRPIAWRGSEMMGVSAQTTRINLAIAVWEWPAYFTPEARLKGIRLDWAIYRRPDPKTAPVHAKAAGLYMICTLSKHAAEAKGYNDALMLDWRGQLAETTGANIFLVRGDELHTPTPDCFLDGITRKAVIGLARQRGLQVVERVIMPQELADFGEMFITGTAAEVTPIAEVSGQQFQVGEVTQTLMADYDALVQPATAPVAAVAAAE